MSTDITGGQRDLQVVHGGGTPDDPSAALRLLENAGRVAERTVADAQTEAEGLIAAARERAAGIEREAQDQAARTRSDAATEAERSRREAMEDTDRRIGEARRQTGELEQSLGRLREEREAAVQAVRDLGARLSELAEQGHSRRD